MVITHGDLSLTNNRADNIGRRLSISLAVISVVCGLAGFSFSLAGEASRSDVKWMNTTVQNSNGFRCCYSRSGRWPLVFAAAASFLFAVPFILEYPYMRPLVRSTSMAIRACLWITVIWILSAEFLLTIVILVASSHLYDWTKPRLRCEEIIPGLFTAAGVLGLGSVFIGFILCITAHITTQRLQQHPRPSAPSS